MKYRAVSGIFYYGGLCVTMNIVIEYLVLFSTTMIYVIVSASYIVWSNSQGSRTQNNSEKNSAGKKNQGLLFMLGDWQGTVPPPPPPPPPPPHDA